MACMRRSVCGIGALKAVYSLELLRQLWYAMDLFICTFMIWGLSTAFVFVCFGCKFVSRDTQCPEIGPILRFESYCAANQFSPKISTGLRTILHFEFLTRPGVDTDFAFSFHRRPLQDTGNRCVLAGFTVSAPGEISGDRCRPLQV